MDGRCYFWRHRDDAPTNGDDTANFQNAVTAGSFVKTGGTSGEYLMADGSVSSGPTGGGGGGEFVHIGEAPPADPQEGQQWMEVPVLAMPPCGCTTGQVAPATWW